MTEPRRFDIEVCSDQDCEGRTEGTLHGHAAFTEIGSATVSLVGDGPLFEVPVGPSPDPSESTP